MHYKRTFGAILTLLNKDQVSTSEPEEKNEALKNHFSINNVLSKKTSDKK